MTSARLTDQWMEIIMTLPPLPHTVRILVVKYVPYRTCKRGWGSREGSHAVLQMHNGRHKYCTIRYRILVQYPRLNLSLR